MATADLLPYDEFLQSRFYLEWARPQGLVDFISAALEKSTTSAAMYGVFRHERHGLTDEEARRRMRLLVPDIRRAVLIAKVIDLKQAEAAMLAQTLDGLRTAMMHNQRGMANSRIDSMALARWRMTARVAVARNEDHTIDAHERPLQSQGILVVRNPQGDSRMAGACLRFAHPDHCDHVVAE